MPDFLCAHAVNALYTNAVVGAGTHSTTYLKFLLGATRSAWVESGRLIGMTTHRSLLHGGKATSGEQRWPRSIYLRSLLAVRSEPIGNGLK